jgi:HSP20 family molecular chaperone IbpA
MYGVTHFNAFEKLSTLHREMDRLFARFWDGEVAGRPISGEWTPHTDITPGDDAWYVHVALPGVDS